MRAGVSAGFFATNSRKPSLAQRVFASREMATLVEAFGFRLSRVKGSHHIFVDPEVGELVNLQNVGGKAKPYQVPQFLRLVERYNVAMGDES